MVRAADTAKQVIDPMLGWGALCSDASAVDVPFEHCQLMQADCADLVAAELKQRIVVGETLPHVLLATES